jgi:hypothetical protein
VPLPSSPSYEAPVSLMNPKLTTPMPLPTQPTLVMPSRIPLTIPALGQNPNPNFNNSGSNPSPMTSVPNLSPPASSMPDQPMNSYPNPNPNPRLIPTKVPTLAPPSFPVMAPLSSPFAQPLLPSNSMQSFQPQPIIPTTSHVQDRLISSASASQQSHVNLFTPHPIATFGFGGKLVVAIPSRTQVLWIF